MYSSQVDIDIARMILVWPLRLHNYGDVKTGAATVKAKLLAASNDWRLLSKQESLSAPILANRKSQDDYNDRAYSEKVYFHPFVQNFLYSGKILTFRQSGPNIWKRLRVHGAYGSEIAHPTRKSVGHSHYVIDIDVERIDISLVEDPGVVLVTVEVSFDKNTLVRRLNRSEKTAQNKSAKRNADHEFLTTRAGLPEVLAVQNALRRLFPPVFVKDFAEAGSSSDGPVTRYLEKQFPLDVEINGVQEVLDEIKSVRPHRDFVHQRRDFLTDDKELLAPWWRSLLSPILEIESCEKSGKPLLENVVDERMPSMMFIASKDAKYITRAERIRLCFADEPGHGLPYAKEFLSDFENKHAYQRFLHYGTEFLMSSYTFNCVTGVADEGFQYELQEHMRRHYYRMFFIVQMQRAALLMFSNWMSDTWKATRVNDSQYYEQIDLVRNKLVAFTHQYWFGNVSNQEQPRELFARMQSLIGNEELYNEVLTESATAREELELRANRNSEENSYVINIWATLFTILGLPIALWTPLTDVKFMDKCDSEGLVWMLLPTCFVALIVVVLLQRRQITKMTSHFARWFSRLVLVFLTVTMCLLLVFWMSGNTDRERW